MYPEATNPPARPDTDQIKDLRERIAREVRSEGPEVAPTFIELHSVGETSDPEHTDRNMSPLVRFGVREGR
jgi:hypothetical protein